MGWLIVAFGTVFLLIVGHIQNSQRVEVVKMQQSGSSHLLARQLLSLAAGINDWRYRHTLTNGTVALSALALPVTPDSRIRHVIVANRLWVWMPEVPGLVDALREQSGGSALIGTVTKGYLR
ncbi:type IV pilus biogenesis protein PilM [Salmonella enterica]|nr:type IV pilus biogenesis protein PilM [Salmonella enterica]